MPYPPVNYARLHRELLDAALPVESVNDEGDITFTRQLTVSEQELVDTILAAHDPVLVPEPVIEERIAALEDALFDLLQLFAAE